QQEADKPSVCPLSESQTQKSIDAFDKIAAFLTSEQRCFNFHGGVNPFIEGTGSDPEDPNAPPSKFEHGGGKVFREGAKSADGQPVIETGCNECHNNRAPRRDGSKSVWMTAPAFLSFVDKDAPTLCRQIRRSIRTAKELIETLKDDHGGNNF